MELILNLLALGDVAHDAMNQGDAAAVIAHCFATSRNPPPASVRAHYFQIKFLNRAHLYHLSHPKAQLVPAFWREVFRQFFLRRCRQRWIKTMDTVEFFRPGDGPGRYVPLPASQVRHALCFYKLLLCLSQCLFSLLAFRDVLQNTSSSINPRRAFDGKVRQEQVPFAEPRVYVLHFESDDSSLKAIIQFFFDHRLEDALVQDLRNSPSHDLIPRHVPVT